MSCHKYNKFQVNLFLFFRSTELDVMFTETQFQVNLFLYFQLTQFVIMFTETQFGVNLDSFQVNSKEFQDIFCHTNEQGSVISSQYGFT